MQSVRFGRDLVEPAGENGKIIGKVYPVLGEALDIRLPLLAPDGSNGATVTVSAGQ